MRNMKQIYLIGTGKTQNFCADGILLKWNNELTDRCENHLDPVRK